MTTFRFQRWQEGFLCSVGVP